MNTKNINEFFISIEYTDSLGNAGSTYANVHADSVEHLEQKARLLLPSGSTLTSVIIYSLTVRLNGALSSSTNFNFAIELHGTPLVKSNEEGSIAVFTKVHTDTLEHAEQHLKESLHAENILLCDFSILPEVRTQEGCIFSFFSKSYIDFHQGNDGAESTTDIVKFSYANVWTKERDYKKAEEIVKNISKCDSLILTKMFLTDDYSKIVDDTFFFEITNNAKNMREDTKELFITMSNIVAKNADEAFSIFKKFAPKEYSNLYIASCTDRAVLEIK